MFSLLIVSKVFVRKGWKFLRSHKGKLLEDAVLNTLGVDDKTAEDVVHEDEQSVGAQVHLGDVDTADGGVIESALHPLRGVGGDEVGVEVRKTAAKGSQTLGSHGVALVGHGG